MDPGLRRDDEVGVFEIPSVAFEQPPTLVPHSSKRTTQSTSFSIVIPAKAGIHT